MTNTTSWVPIPNYTGMYLINEGGKVLNTKPGARRTEISSRVDRGGYETVRLIKNGVTRTRYIHVLVATCFVPNPLNKPFVNHKNGNKRDNRPENLEWVTHAENIQHAFDNALINQKRKERRVVDLANGRVFRSANEAANHCGIRYSTLKNFLNGARPNKTPLRYVTEKKEAA